MLSGFFHNQSSTSSTLSSNAIPNSKGEMKAITTRSGVAYKGHSIPTPKKVVERETEETMDEEQTNFQGSTTHIQPPVTLISEPDVLKILPKPNIPYPSRLNDQKLREKATNQMEKFFQIFQDLHFEFSFADALLLMPKFAFTIKSLLTNKDKLFELAKIPLNENCSKMLLKNLLEKLGDLDKFLIPCDFPRMDVCHALADLDASINLMPLSIWKKAFLPELTPTVDFEADPRVPLILRRSFLRTGHVLIDVYGEEITLRVNDKAVTFDLNQTTRYSSTYDDLSVNRIDIIDVAREEYAQEILGFSKNSSGGNPTSTSEPILFDSSHSLTPFEGTDFILEEIESYLKDDPISPKIDHADCDPEGDIFLIEKLLNDDPFQLPLMDLSKDVAIDHVKLKAKEDPAVKRYQAMKRKPQTEAQARKTMMMYLKNVAGFKMDYFKGMSYDDIHPIFEAKFNSNVDFLLKIKEQMEEVESRALQTINETLARKAAKRRKLNEEVEDLKRHLEIVPDEDDALKPLHLQERGDLEALWNLVKESKRRNSLRTLNITSGTIPTFFEYVQIKSFDGVCMAKKLMISSKLVMKDPPGAIMVPISPQENFMGPFPSSRGNRYILVAVDCLSKWVEAKALPTNNARVVVKFLKSPFARFGTPRAIISDRETHFCNDKFAKVMSKEKTKTLHDSKIKNRIFNVGDRVLLFNSRLKIFPGKLKTRWLVLF
nr:reverse transcriptase domain-containing protein [Tanacetum cinerariifolium]